MTGGRTPLVPCRGGNQWHRKAFRNFHLPSIAAPESDLKVQSEALQESQVPRHSIITFSLLNVSI